MNVKVMVAGVYLSISADAAVVCRHLEAVWKPLISIRFYLCASVGTLQEGEEVVTSTSAYDVG